MIKIYLDDCRVPSQTFNYKKDTIYLTDDWQIVKNYEQFVEAVTNTYKEYGYLPHIVSLDHDLDEMHHLIPFEDWASHSADDMGLRETGYDCLKWLIDYSKKVKANLPKVMLHTMNPVGRQNMANLYEDYMKEMYHSFKQDK